MLRRADTGLDLAMIERLREGRFDAASSPTMCPRRSSGGACATRSAGSSTS